MPKLSFITDVHGNLESVEAFLKKSKEQDVNHIIFGGDAAPKKVAFSLSCGGAIPAFSIPHKGIAEYLSQCPIEPAATLERRGYMLFPEDYSLRELQLLAMFQENLEHFHSGEKIIIDEETLELFKGKARQPILNYLKYDSDAQNVFQRFREDMNRLSGKAVPLVDEEDFYERLLVLMMLQLPPVEGETKLQTMERQIGRAIGKITYTELISKAVILDSRMFKALLKVICNCFPWGRFELINPRLYEYALPYQERWAGDFVTLIKDFRRHFKGTVSIILGNDDHLELSEIFDEANKEGVLHHATNRTLMLPGGIQMIGYSCVPHHSAPATYREWCRSEDEMEEELAALIHEIKADAKLVIGSFHSPPSGLGLAEARVPGLDDTEFGSTAIKKIIESLRSSGQKGIDILLSGHIHKSWKLTGKVYAKLGDTHVFNPGDSEYSPRMLVMDTEHPEVYELLVGGE